MELNQEIKEKAENIMAKGNKPSGLDYLTSRTKRTLDLGLSGPTSPLVLLTMATIGTAIFFAR